MSFFAKTVTITGGTGKRLSEALTENSFAGSFMGITLSLRAPAGASLFVGSASTVTNSGATKGFEILAGEAESWSSGSPQQLIDPTQFYLYLVADGEIGINFFSM
jgi:hypothetical protein